MAGLENVDSNKLDLEDLGEVFEAMEEVAVDYKSIGVALRVKYAELQIIENKYAYQNVKAGLKEVLTQWLKSNYTKKEQDNPQWPSWRKVVEVVDKSWAGNNHALASTIAENHPMIVGTTGGVAKKKASRQQVVHSSPPAVPGSLDMPSHAKASFSTQPTDHSRGGQLLISSRGTISKPCEVPTDDLDSPSKLSPCDLRAPTPADNTRPSSHGEHSGAPSQSGLLQSEHQGSSGQIQSTSFQGDFRQPHLKTGGANHKHLGEQSQLPPAQPQDKGQSGSGHPAVPPPAAHQPHGGSWPTYPQFYHPYPFGYYGNQPVMNYPLPPYVAPPGGNEAYPLQWPTRPPGPPPPTLGADPPSQASQPSAYSSAALETNQRETSEEGVTGTSQEAISRDKGKLHHKTPHGGDARSQPATTDKGANPNTVLLHPPYPRDCKFKKIGLTHGKLAEPAKPVGDMRTQEEVYDMSCSPHGFAVIINNCNFKDPAKTRNGSNVDRDDLVTTFRYLGYIVEQHNDLTANKIKSLFDQICLRDYSEFDSFVCCILSHGSDNVVYGTDGKVVEINNLTRKVNASFCTTLTGKPKLFFIQACRGLCESAGVEEATVPAAVKETTDGPDEPDAPAKPCLLSEAMPTSQGVVTDANISPWADFLVGYATVSDYVSYRDVDYGSWYMQELCHALCTQSTCKPLTEIMRIVNDKVNTKHSTNERRQAPVYLCSLRKTVFFWPE